jgi:ribosome modulation factor
MGKANANTRGYTMGHNYKNYRESPYFKPKTNVKAGLLKIYNLAKKNKYYKTKKANQRFVAGWRLSKKDPTKKKR